MGRDRKFSFSSKPKEEVPLLDIKQVGLLNLGNSCFYNTVVQTLTVTRPLASLIADPPPSSPALALISPASTAFNPDPESYPSPLPISSALVSTLAKLAPTPEEAKTQPKTFNPKALLRELSRKHEEYAQATQQDSHELLRHLIDGIYMEEVDLIKKVVKMPQGTLLPKRRKRSSTVRQELNRPVEGSAAVPLTENGTIQEEPEPLSPADEEAAVEEEESTEGVDADEEDEELEEAEDSDSDESTSSSESDTSDDERSEDDERKIAQEKKEKKAKKKLRPFIDSVFGGKLASVVICDECKNVSLTREDFMDLSLSLKDDDAKMRK
ncbi:ubiquitin carboxyl-terminal hydrolase 16/45, partial [Pseudohyphozyma bogoriensis]